MFSRRSHARQYLERKTKRLTPDQCAALNAELVMCLIDRLSAMECEESIDAAIKLVKSLPPTPMGRPPAPPRPPVSLGRTEDGELAVRRGR